jgi:hypothetical protein
MEGVYSVSARGWIRGRTKWRDGLCAVLSRKASVERPVPIIGTGIVAVCQDLVKTGKMIGIKHEKKENKR